MGDMPAPEQPSAEHKGQRRSNRIPLRHLLPNLVTLLSLCSGLTAVRLGFEGRFELAVTAVIVCVVLDAIDGRLARFLKVTSRFGAELDSLADFVNFGVVPSLLIYFWSLDALGTKGWLVCLMLPICCAMRLARFNVALDDDKKPPYAARFFTGVPAPAGAGLALAPMYLGFLGMMDNGMRYAWLIAPYVACVALLMASRIPTFSGKSRGGFGISREQVLPVTSISLAYMISLFTYSWMTLTLTALAYFISLPLAVRAHNRAAHEHRKGLSLMDVAE